MASTTGNLRRLPTFRPDQHDVPPATRTNDLLRLARTIADLTSPAQRVVLEPEDRLLLAMALPNLLDDAAQTRLLGVVAELHTAAMAENVDPAEPDWTDPDDYRRSAAELARDAVQADLQAGAGFPQACGPRREPCGCEWIETWDSHHEGGDLEKVPCERHRVVVDLDELRRCGWQDIHGGGF